MQSEVRYRQLYESYNIGKKYSAIYLMNKEGLALASTAESFVGNNYGFRDYFQQAISGNSWTDISVGVTSRELGHYFSHPVKNKNDDFLGVLVAKIIPDYINSTLVDHIDFFSEDHLMLIDQDGVISFLSNK